jgi:hypothetical protein
VSAEEFLPLRESLVDEVLGGLRAIEEDPKVEAVLVLSEFGVGQKSGEGDEEQGS